MALAVDGTTFDWWVLIPKKTGFLGIGTSSWPLKAGAPYISNPKQITSRTQLFVMVYYWFREVTSKKCLMDVNSEKKGGL